MPFLTFQIFRMLSRYADISSMMPAADAVICQIDHFFSMIFFRKIEMTFRLLISRRCYGGAELMPIFSPEEDIDYFH